MALEPELRLAGHRLESKWLLLLVRQIGIAWE